MYRMNVVSFEERLDISPKSIGVYQHQLVNNDKLPYSLAALTIDTSIVDIKWTTDTGAPNHITTNSSMLNNFKKYVGYDFVFLGYGSPLKIDAIAHTLVSDGKHKLMLRDVLLVP